LNKKKINDALNKLVAAYESTPFCYSMKFDIKDPASEETVVEAEKQIGCDFPRELRYFFRTLSEDCELFALLDEHLLMPEMLRGVYGGSFRIAVSEAVAAEAERKRRADSCTECGCAWKDKLGFMRVGNGDIIALDTKADPKDPPVVYLSRKGGEGNGCILSRTFGEYIETVIAIGGCGPDDDILAVFCENGRLAPNGEKAAAYRNIISFELPEDYFEKTEDFVIPKSCEGCGHSHSHCSGCHDHEEQSCGGDDEHSCSCNDCHEE